MNRIYLIVSNKISLSSATVVMLLLCTSSIFANSGEPASSFPLPASANFQGINERLAAGEDIVQEYGNLTLINFDGQFSEALLQEQGNKLASIEGPDVHVSYVADYAQTEDQFTEYEREGVIDHLREEYKPTGGVYTQQQLDAYMNAPSSFIDRHVGAYYNERTIHIVYMALMFLNGEGGTEYQLTKNLVFGDQVIQVNKIKARQVRSLVGFELGSGNNDAYLQDYIDELYRAFMDRSYVVTGSVFYKDVPYFNNDTIYISDQHDGVVSQRSQNAPTALTFGVNERDNVGTVRWREVDTGGEAMLNQTTGENITASFHRAHYQQLSRIDVEYGNGRSTVVHIMPINLGIDIRGPDWYQMQQTNPLAISITNNGVLFDLPVSTMVFANALATNIDPIQHLPGQDAVYERTPRKEGPNKCGSVVIRADFRRKGSANDLSSAFSKKVELKCARDLIGLRVIPYTYGAESEQFIKQQKREAEAGETVYFVTSNGNKFQRKLEVTGLYDDPQPESNDFWYRDAGENGYTPSTKEPLWDYSFETSERKKASGRNERQFTFSEDYFPGTFEWFNVADAFANLDLLNPDTYIDAFGKLEGNLLGMNDINQVDDIIIYDAFGQQLKASAGFLRENRWSYKLSQFPLKFGKKIEEAQEDLDERTDLSKKVADNASQAEEGFADYEPSDSDRYWEWPNANEAPPAKKKLSDYFSSSYDVGVSIYNFEDSESPSYRNAIKITPTGSAIAKTPQIPIFTWPNPVIKAGFFVQMEFGSGMAGSLVLSKDHKDSYLSVDSYDLDNISIEGFGKLNFKAIAQIKFADNIEQATQDLFRASASATLSYPFELKYKYTLPADKITFATADEGKHSLEFNHGPAVLNINVVVRVSASVPFLPAWEWDAVDVNFPLTLSEKRFERWCWKPDGDNYNEGPCDE